jgi:uncharacterized protein
MPNRLAQERSPYLQQHQNNPVDWFPWGPEALERAKTEDRPILLSIGYSACHWCHVMAHESFENPEIAALMNSLFVNLKVDREERPDLDDVYQHAIQLLGRQGGWPLTVFLTPAGVPFFGGTYFPDQDRHGLPAFEKILRGVAQAFRERRAEVETSGRQLLSALHSLQEPPTPGLATPKDFGLAVSRLLGRVDEEHGGFGSAPKFPNTMGLEVLLRSAALDGNERAGQAVHQALARMADGGIHDQLGGGFHRYSVDEAWAVPHFEKMLYDNALLANLYLAAHQWSAAPRYLDVARGILDYLGREMTDGGGGLYSSQDADSAGPDGRIEEGEFYVWTRAQIEAVVGPALAPRLWDLLGVTAAGNFEGTGRSVLSRHGAPDSEAAAGLQKLLSAREARPRPFRDEKILAAWNGLALSATARGAQLLGDQKLADRARAIGSFVRGHLMPGGELRRAFLGEAGQVPAFAEDLALLAVGFLDLYDTLFEVRDLDLARKLIDALLEDCLEEERGAMAVASRRAEKLVHRPLSLYDNAIPSATSAGLEALQRLGWLTGESRYRAAAEKLVRSQVSPMTQNPFGFGNLLCGLDRHLRGPVEIVVVGRLDDPRTRALLAAVSAVYLPNRALVAFAPGAPPTQIDPLLWKGRESSPLPTAFVCRDRTCLAPIQDPQELPAALRNAAREG